MLAAAFRAVWSLHPIRTPLASLFAGLAITLASMPLRLAFVSYETPGGVGKEVGFLPALNPSIALALVPPAALILSFFVLVAGLSIAIASLEPDVGGPTRLALDLKSLDARPGFEHFDAPFLKYFRPLCLNNSTYICLGFDKSSFEMRGGPTRPNIVWFHVGNLERAAVLAA